MTSCQRCDRPAKAQRLCSLHYERAKVAGEIQNVQVQAPPQEGVSPERLEQIRAMHDNGTLLAHVQGLFDYYLGPDPAAGIGGCGMFECMFCDAQVTAEGVARDTGSVRCFPDEPDIPDAHVPQLVAA